MLKNIFNQTGFISSWTGDLKWETLTKEFFLFHLKVMQKLMSVWLRSLVRIDWLSHRLYTTHRQHCLPEKHSKGNHPNKCSNNNSFPRAPKKALSRLPLFWEQWNGLFSQTEKKNTLINDIFHIRCITCLYIKSQNNLLCLLHNKRSYTKKSSLNLANYKTTFELCTEFSWELNTKALQVTRRIYTIASIIAKYFLPL